MKLILLILLACNQIGISQNWEKITDSNLLITSITKDPQDSFLFICGNFSYINGIPYSSIFSFDGVNFDSLDCGVGSLCGSTLPLGGVSGAAKTIYNDNKLFTTGYFGIASNIATAGLAYYENNNWNSFGTGLLLYNGNWGRGRYLCKDTNNVYLCGTFDSVNGVPAQSVAIYDGTTWFEPQNFTSVIPNLPNGFNTVQPYKDYLYLSGTFCDNENPERKICRLARFKDGEWSGVGNGIFSSLGYVNSMVVYKDKLIVGGTMSISQEDPGNGLAAWDGNTWDNMGGGIYSSSVVKVNEMKVLGEYLYVAGIFEAAGGQLARGFARWDGTNWCSLDAFEDTTYFAQITAFDFLNDSLYVAGDLYSPSGYNYGIYKNLNFTDFGNCGNTTSINEPKQNNVFTIYPNPTSNSFSIHSDFKIDNTVKLLDLQGRLVKVYPNQTNYEIEELSSGLYFVTFSINQITYNLKLLKP